MFTKSHQGATIGWSLVVLTLILTLASPSAVHASGNTTSSEQVNLKMYQFFSLKNTSSVTFEREFALTDKQAVSLLRIKTKATQNVVTQVQVNSTLNGVETTQTFEDSGTNYNSPYTFFDGTTLIVQVNTSTPLFILANYIKLTIEVKTRTLFNSDPGMFVVDEVTFENFNPPSIATGVKNVQLPLQISQGSWYISPLTLLKERQFESKIYTQVEENLRVRLDVSIKPATLPLSLVQFRITTGHSSYQSNDSSTSTTIVADLITNDELTLHMKFRASSDLTTDVVGLTIDVTVSHLPLFQPNPTSSALTDYALPNLPFTFLEALRYVVILIPVVFLFLRKSHQKNTRKESVTEKV